MEHAIKVNVAVIVTDDERRQIRHGYLGRGGVATRKEIRVWVDALVKAGLKGLPEPKVRRRDSAQRSVADLDHVDIVKKSRRDIAASAPDDAICAKCQRPKHEHGRMAFSCPPRPGRAGGTFTLEDA